MTDKVSIYSKYGTKYGVYDQLYADNFIVGDSDASFEGSVRYHGGKFEMRDGDGWKELVLGVDSTVYFQEDVLCNNMLLGDSVKTTAGGLRLNNATVELKPTLGEPWIGLRRLDNGENFRVGGAFEEVGNGGMKYDSSAKMVLVKQSEAGDWRYLYRLGDPVANTTDITAADGCLKIDSGALNLYQSSSWRPLYRLGDPVANATATAADGALKLDTGELNLYQTSSWKPVQRKRDPVDLNTVLAQSDSGNAGCLFYDGLETDVQIRTGVGISRTLMPPQLVGEPNPHKLKVVKAKIVWTRSGGGDGGTGGFTVTGHGFTFTNITFTEFANVNYGFQLTYTSSYLTPPFVSAQAHNDSLSTVYQIKAFSRTTTDVKFVLMGGDGSSLARGSFPSDNYEVHIQVIGY